MKKAIVTGAAGFIGSHLVDKLLEEGYYVIGIDSFITGKYQRRDVDNFIMFTMDIAGNDFLPQMEYLPKIFSGVEVVFHCAAIARIGPSVENPEKYYKNNVLSTLHILEWCAKNHVKLVYSSSSSVWFNDNPYAHSKLIGEAMCRMYANLYNMDIQCLRYYNVYGDRMAAGSYSTVLEKFKSAMLKNKPLYIYANNENDSPVRDFTYVGDIVQANLLMLKVKGLRVFEVGSNNPHNIAEIAKLFSNNIQYVDPLNLPIPQIATRRETRANITDIMEIGYQPTMDVMDWITSHYLKKPDLNTRYNLYKLKCVENHYPVFIPNFICSCGKHPIAYYTEAEIMANYKLTSCPFCNKSYCD